MKEVNPSDWKSKAGYDIKITSSSEREQENLENIQKLMAVKGQMTDNPVLTRIVSKKLMELVDLSSEEIKEVIDYEKNKPMMMPQMPESTSPEALQLQQSTQRLKQLAPAI